jgi:hypothetical protein
MDSLPFTTPIYQPDTAHGPVDTTHDRDTRDISVDCSLTVYENEVYKHLHKLEDVWCRSIRPKYATGSHHAYRRNICVNWMTRLAVDTGASLQATHLAAAYFDAMFAHNMHFPVKHDQLLISTCLFTASKQVDTKHMWIPEYVYYAAKSFTKRDVLMMEAYLLFVLDWKLELPSAYAFLQLYVNAVRRTNMSSDRFESLAGYLINCTLILGKGLPNSSPSMVAHAACLLACASLGMDGAVERILMQLGPHNEYALDFCVEELRAYVQLMRQNWLKDTAHSAEDIINRDLPTYCTRTILDLRRNARLILHHTSDIASLVSLLQNNSFLRNYFDNASTRKIMLDMIHTNDAFDRPAPILTSLIWMRPAWWVRSQCLTPSPTCTRTSRNTTTPMTSGKRPYTHSLDQSKRQQS